MIAFSLYKKLNGPEGNQDLDVQGQIKKGEFVCLYGASGAGKTSLLRILSGLDDSAFGSVQYGTEYWLDTDRKLFVKPQKRAVGLVFQDYALFPNMTVWENLKYALPKGESEDILHELIKIIELEELKNQKPKKLSGGQQQRVALARALVCKPKLLLLDEPLSALDHRMRSKLQDYILEAHKKYALTTILISHDIPEIFKLSDRVLVLKKGSIVNNGKPETVFAEQSLSGKFQFTGEIIKIEKESIVYILTILIGTNMIKVVANEQEVENLQIGNKVLVASKAFNPVIQKLD